MGSVFVLSMKRFYFVQKKDLTDNSNGGVSKFSKYAYCFRKEKRKKLQ
jgi:hypothetical protein